MTDTEQQDEQREKRTGPKHRKPRALWAPRRHGIGRQILEQVPSPSRDAALMGVDQTMKVLDIRARSTIYKLVKQGLLTKVKILGATKFRVDEVRDLQGKIG